MGFPILNVGAAVAMLLVLRRWTEVVRNIAQPAIFIAKHALLWRELGTATLRGVLRAFAWAVWASGVALPMSAISGSVSGRGDFCSRFDDIAVPMGCSVWMETCSRKNRTRPSSPVICLGRTSPDRREEKRAA